MPYATDHTIKTRLLLRPIKSPFGTLRLGGVNKGGFGVGHEPGPPRRLRCYGFVLIMGGQGVYSDAKTSAATVKEGDAVLFFPGIPHRCHTRAGEFWDELWFEFEGPVFDLLRRTKLLDPARPIRRVGNSDHWFRRFFQIIPPMHLRRKMPPQVVVSRFIAALAELLAGNEAPDAAPAPQDDWLNTACELLSTHESTPGLQPAVVARRLGFSYETFRKRFRAAIGFSPGQFHLDSRIDRAAALLHQGQLTVKEIASQLQFCDPFHFSRSFKRRFGQAPKGFQKRVRG
ncbi:MAG TPA: AraC family transcriptional regulator [Opitutaceae bacterium]|nr:AraC family transcriptional regulator [Opitutaceae bacterium]